MRSFRCKLLLNGTSWPCKVFTYATLGIGRSSHSITSPTHTSISTPLSQISSRSTRPEFGCRQSTLLLLLARHLAFKLPVVLDPVLSEPVAQHKVKDVPRLPNKPRIVFHQQDVVIKVSLPNHLRPPWIDQQCHPPHFSRRVTQHTTIILRLARLLAMLPSPQVASSQWIHLVSLQQLITKACLLGSLRRTVPRRLMIPRTSAEVPMDLRQVMIHGLALLRVYP